MKIILVTVIFLQLLAVKESPAQIKLKDKLRELENGKYIKQDFPEPVGKVKYQKEKQPYDQLELVLDSLIVFVRTKKQQDALFEKEVEPYLNEKLSPGRLILFEFNEEEELVYESFLMALNWEDLTSRIAVYEDFIFINHKDIEPFQSILRLFSYLRKVQGYITMHNQNIPIRRHLEADFKAYNAMDWMVFLRHPDAMILWLTAVYAWNCDPQKCTEKL